MKDLAALLRGTKRLATLNLAGAALGAKPLADLAEALRRNRTLRKLILAHTPALDAPAVGQDLGEAVAETDIVHLNRDNSAIRAPALKALLQALTHTPRTTLALKSLSLAGNGLARTAAPDLVRQLPTVDITW